MAESHPGSSAGEVDAIMKSLQELINESRSPADTAAPTISLNHESKAFLVALQFSCGSLGGASHAGSAYANSFLVLTDTHYEDSNGTKLLSVTLTRSDDPEEDQPVAVSSYYLTKGAADRGVPRLRADATKMQQFNEAFAEWQIVGGTSHALAYPPPTSVHQAVKDFLDPPNTLVMRFPTNT